MPGPVDMQSAVTDADHAPTPPTSPPAAPWQPSNPDTDKLLVPASKVVPFIGAGVSAAAGLPTGEDIRQRLRAEFPDDAVHDPNLRTVATSIIKAKPGRDRDVQQCVARLFRETRNRLKLTPALRAIAGIPSKWVVTLNYDDSVEQAAARLGIDVATYTWKELPSGDETISPAKHPLNVLHLHGRLEEPETIVLDEDSYRRFVNDDRVKAFLSQLLLHHNACFVGTRLDEAYLVNFLAALPTREPKHVFFAQRRVVDAIQNGRSAVTTSVHNVIFEPFPDGDWNRLDQFCQHYFTAVTREHVALAAAEFIVPQPVALFVPPVLIPAEGEGHNGRPSRWSIELGYDDPIAAKDLATKARTLIVGRPGAGKTQLLRRAAIDVPDDERAVYVRLAHATEPIGDPAAALAVWARATQRPDCERRLKRKDLEFQRFHFLLDGLDEVPSARQAKLADRINEMARALPQHRFTVTSRAVPAVDRFSPSEWERLELITASEWRDEYLAKARVTYDALRAKVPALSDLDDLLELPFFLAAVVDLYQAGRLPAHGDLMTVIQALIDRAFDAEELEPVRDAVRPWLRNVAFAMQVAGRSELRVHELQSVELPADLNLGPEDDVLDLLARRSLLEHADGHVRFVHRLVADTLTAEKLIELGPEHPGLLDVIAPATDAIAGLRSDWWVVMTLVGARSPAWRAAIAGRDRLAAARMVPPTADVDERREAAQTLWRAYLESRLRMHDYDVPSLLHDAAVMGRLLRQRDVPEVVDEVLGGIHHSSPQVRSNAIEVLAEAELDAELEAVVRAALAGDPEPVVRRQATSAASKRSLISAFPLIKQRALHSADEPETQTAVAFALSLAPLDELVPFAIELIESGRGKHWPIESITRARGGAVAALAVMRKKAERGELARRNEREMARLLDELPDDEETVEHLAFIAALGAGGVDWMAERLAVHPEAAARGLVAGMEWERTRRSEALRYIRLLPEEALEAVEFNDAELHAWLKRCLDHRPQVAWDDAAAAVADDEPEDAEPAPTLAELLDRTDEEADWLLIRDATHLAPDVQGLDARHRRELLRRINVWWPVDGVAAAITDNRIGWHAHACLAYGSQLAPPLTMEQWVDVALTRIPYEGKDEWLRRQYSRAAAVEAARRCRAEKTEPWARLADAIPRRLPAPVVEAMADHIKTADHYLDALLARLRSERHLRALRKLSSVANGVGEAAISYLARSGDLDAQQRCLSALIEQLGTDRCIRSDDLGWMEGITDRRLLRDLFTALVKSHQHRNPDGFNDAMAPIRAAIRRIGGIEAIEAYDELIATEPPVFEGVHFLRRQRDVLVDDILRTAGDALRSDLLDRLGLPDLVG